MLPFAVIVNGQALVLENSQLSFRGQSPVFHRQYIPGIRNLPTRIPAHPTNLKALGFPHEVHRAELPAELPCQVLLFDSIYINGTLRVTECTEEAFEIHISDPITRFSQEAGEGLISSFALPEGSTGRTEKARVHIRWDVAQQTEMYELYLNGETYAYTVQFGDTPEDIAGYFRTQINADFPGYANFGPTDDILEVEQPNLSDPFEFGWFTAAVVGVDWTILLNRQLTMVKEDAWQAWFQDVLDNPANYPFRLWSLHNPFHYGEDGNPQWSGWINRYFNGDATTNGRHTSMAWEYACVPTPLVKPVLEAIITQLGYELLLDDAVADGLDELCFFSLEAIDELHREWTETGGGTGEWRWVNAHRESFALAGQLPTMSVAQLLNSLAIITNSMWSFDSRQRTARLHSVGTVLASQPVADLAGQELAGYKVVYEERQGYTFAHSEDQADEWYKRLAYARPYVHGNGGQAITNPSGVLHMAFQPDGGRMGRVPVVHQLGNTHATGLEPQPEPAEYLPRFIYYRGMAGMANPYPLASTDHRDALNNPTAAPSLLWEGDTGIIATWWLPWLHYMEQAIRIELSIHPDALGPGLLQFLERIRALGAPCLVAEYTLKVPGREWVEVVVYK